MAVLNQSDIADPQREVQRLLGRCLLRLQQYERLLKAMIGIQKLSGTPETLPHALAARKAEASDKTLGTLIGRLMGDYIVKEGSESPDDPPKHPSSPFHFSFRMQFNLPAERHEALNAELRELVTLRNSLVHHFIDLHDLWTIDGCLQAQDSLNRSYAEIDRHVEQLATLAGYMDDARQAAAELIQSPQFYDTVVNGIGPDGQIYWPIAGIVGALREALRELSIDGWVNLDAAVLWVSEHHPQQTPQKYGCSRWRQVIHESGQFELRRFAHNGQFGAWYRERPNAIDC
ncbi:MAG: OST-HTH/LOTUS domain-containing protein [Proteobacteria bacterium]|nr:OST-HTH/LOTUS domain-containing protein [Pseudomonadota bacterium]